MAGQDGGRQATNASDWARGLEKRLLHEERRPSIRTASDIMGPGLAPYAVELFDWNADEATFNGHWFSQPGASNSPDPAKVNFYAGITICTEGGYGIQQVTQYREPIGAVFGDWEPNSFVRRFYTLTGGSHRSYSVWKLTFGTAP